jgi:hypothetical protein
MRRRPPRVRDAGPLAGASGRSPPRSPRRALRQFLRSPANRVEQKLAFSSADHLSAGLQIPVRIGQLALQLGDAIGQQAQILLRGIGRALGTAHGVSLPGSLATFISHGEIQTASTAASLPGQKDRCREQAACSGGGCPWIDRAVRRPLARSAGAPGAGWSARARSRRGCRLLRPTSSPALVDLPDGAL